MSDAPALVWQRFTEGLARSASPELGVVGLALLVLAAALLSVPRRSWRFFGLFVTVVHELGHAAAAVITLQRISGITLRLDHSGVTTSRGRGGWRSAFTTFWGYPVPAVVGATLLWCTAYGWAPAALSLGALVLVGALLLVRNLQGALILGGTAAVSVALVAVGGEAAAYTCLALGIALLVGSCRDWVKVLRVHTRRRDLSTSDAYLLRMRTHIPSAVWLGLFALVIGTALAVSVIPLSRIAGVELALP